MTAGLIAQKFAIATESAHFDDEKALESRKAATVTLMAAQKHFYTKVPRAQGAQLKTDATKPHSALQSKDAGKHVRYIKPA